ncbi:MAG: hypothetical protein CM15mP74_07520 [Halieaceae bacterium]|nr:MAG: hypothetical protein CM15mP74_07520 [Halieaceae bacterium]
MTTVGASVPGIDNALTETDRAGNTANCSVSVSVFHQGMRISEASISARACDQRLTLNTLSLQAVS